MVVDPSLRGMTEVFIQGDEHGSEEEAQHQGPHRLHEPRRLGGPEAQDEGHLADEEGGRRGLDRVVHPRRGRL